MCAAKITSCSLGKLKKGEGKLPFLGVKADSHEAHWLMTTFLSSHEEVTIFRKTKPEKAPLKRPVRVFSTGYPSVLNALAQRAKGPTRVACCLGEDRNEQRNETLQGWILMRRHFYYHSVIFAFDLKAHMKYLLCPGPQC